MRAGNIVVRHFKLESFHLKDWTGVYDVMTSKVSDFSHPRKFIKRVSFKNWRFRCADSQGRIVKSALSKVPGFLWTGPEWRLLCF